MGEDIMIVRSERDKLSIKIRNKVHKKFTPDNYCKTLNPKDYNDLARLFEDLDIIIGAPVEKAFRSYKDKKEKGFPF